jgi:hypothetical protein
MQTCKLALEDPVYLNLTTYQKTPINTSHHQIPQVPSMCKHHLPRYACTHEGEIISTELCDWQAEAQKLLKSEAARDPMIQHRILTWKRICERQSTTIYGEQSEDCARCERKRLRKEAWEEEEQKGTGERGKGEKRVRVV